MSPLSSLLSISSFTYAVPKNAGRQRTKKQPSTISGKNHVPQCRDDSNGSPSISIIARHQGIPVSFHTTYPSISIQKFCHTSNSLQESLLFPYKVEKDCFLKNNHFNIPKPCTGKSKKQFK